MKSRRMRRRRTRWMRRRMRITLSLIAKNLSLFTSERW
jgi:hypothetical protein